MDSFLETERMVIRLTSEDDFDDILALRSDPMVQKFTTQPPATEKDVQRFIDTVIPYQEKHGHAMASVFDKDSSEFAGQAGIFHVGHYDFQPEIEIGYRFHVKFWGKGIATEITRALVAWGFEHLTVDLLIAFVETENVVSRRVLEKLGFSHVGLTKCHYGMLERYEIHRN